MIIPLLVGEQDLPDHDGGLRLREGHRLRVRHLTDADKEANRLLSRERAAVEHGFANLKAWRFITKLRMNARHATTLLRALLVLANSEVQR
ncbi:hypothetical protein OG930_42215 [Streptomyces sp. NBC_01799]|nr:hypothetical protein OG930_42215 [Streptomyces sp. NBC_01799]